MLLHVPADLVQFRRTETEVGGERNRLKPEFRFELIARNVDMRRLVVFPAVEMEPVRSDTEHGGHGAGNW